MKIISNQARTLDLQLKSVHNYHQAGNTKLDKDLNCAENKVRK